VAQARGDAKANGGVLAEATAIKGRGWGRLVCWLVLAGVGGCCTGGVVEVEVESGGRGCIRGQRAKMDGGECASTFIMMG
jgi:hypothetical protein